MNITLFYQPLKITWRQITRKDEEVKAIGKFYSLLIKMNNPGGLITGVIGTR